MSIDDPLAELDSDARSDQPDLTLVSVIGGNTQVDVALPAGTPVAALLPDLVALIGSRTPSHRRHRSESEDKRARWTLGKVGQAPIDSSRSLNEAQILDGDLLVLRSVTAREAPPMFDDVVDAVAQLNTTQFPTWGAAAARRTGHVLAVLAAVLAGVALVVARTHSGSVVVGAVGLGAALAVVVAAIVVARQYHDSGTATALCACAQPLAFAGALTVTPGGLGAPHLTFAAAASLVVAVILYRTTAVGPLLHSAVFVASIGGVIAGGVEQIYGSDTVKIGAALAALSVLAVLLAPRLTIWFARLPLPPVPTSGGPIDPVDPGVRPTIEGIGAIGAMALPSAVALERRAHTANQYLSGVVLGAAVLALVGGLAASDPRRPSDWRVTVLVVIVAVVLALRGRSHGDRVQASTLIATGAALTAMEMLVLGTRDLTGAYTAFGGLLVVVVLALLCGVVAPATAFTPVSKRFGEIGEYMLLGVIAPLTFWILEIYATVRSL
ncbi:type VII secretion integral membrane protein EccD [Williamsia sp.]|uniref:type VII secretion integral membrane protein EccD n=1 Tax=Williamsia sp. TaxID=1872085 RepID=UPI001A33B630|nr:type VII secretion integral membrane protein EccD [Williamsia sp.]MBJ7290277.1 type VII secretion integral membrane protein EccD [Williamsia sp.]